MAPGVSANGETARHARLKRLALVWAQAQGFSVCGIEVSLPRCRYRADMAAYRGQRREIGATAIFECKQALCDLRRDNCDSELSGRQLEMICKRRQILETHLRAHYPSLRNSDSLFPEFDLQSFTAIGHRGYARISRQLGTLQNRLYDCTKFEKLIRYRCANLFFLVVPEEIFRDREIPVGWGALVESNSALTLVRKPIWYETTEENRIRLLHRIALAGTRALNHQLKIALDQIAEPRH
ncbi:MAG: hypothetical protein DMF00_14725 [Verrucomicrobia bacterium]|nr:MAG: hypothetical protein DMF00_14725 [Verrucomicrobiota bacterium]